MKENKELKEQKENKEIENKQNEKLKKFKTLKILKYIIFYILIIFTGFYIGFSFVAPDKVIEIFGFKTYVVESDSMKPVFQRGDLLLVTKVNSNAIKNGDIIAVKRSDNKLIAHIVAEQIINEDHKLVFKTRPLNNKDKNTWDIEGARRYQIIGKVRKAIPKIGFIVFFLKNKYVHIPAIIILLIYLFFIKYKNKEDLSININNRKQRNKEKK